MFFAQDPAFATDARGRTPLFAAAQQGSLADVQRIVFGQVGTGIFPPRLALLLVKDRHGLTAADVAEQSGHEAVAQLLRTEASRMEWCE